MRQRRVADAPNDNQQPVKAPNPAPPRARKGRRERWRGIAEIRSRPRRTESGLLRAPAQPSDPERGNDPRVFDSDKS